MVKSPVPMYSAVLTSLGCEVDANDLVSFIMPSGDRSPLLVEGKRLVIPTPEMLGRINSDQHIAYHPLCEMIMKNESQVQAKIRNVINIKTMFVISTLMLELIGIAISEDKEILAKSAFYDLFEQMNEATPRTQKSVKALVETLKPSGLTKRLVNFSSKSVGKINDKSYRRITSVVFPIMEEFKANTPSDRIFDVKMAKKDKEVIHRLIKYIVPNIDVVDYYSQGSESMIAPNFDSLVKSYAMLMTDVNKVSWKFKDSLANVSFLNADLGYMDMIKDLEQYKGFLPVLEGNQGEENINAKTSSENSISVGGLTPTVIRTDNVPVIPGALTSPSVTGTVKTVADVAASTAAANVAGTAGLAKLATMPAMGMMGMMGGTNPMGMMGAFPGMNMMGGFNGFPTMANPNPNGGFIHPNGQAGINPALAMGFNGMGMGMPNMGMMGNMNPMMGMNGMAPNMMGGMGMMGFGQQLPHGCVMGRSGKVVNLITDTIDVLEKELPPDLFNQVYSQRCMQGTIANQQAAFMNMMGGVGFKTA